MIGTSLRTPGSVSTVSLTIALPAATSTDSDAVPEIANGSRVALRRAPADGVGFDVAADAAGANPTAATNADTLTAAVTAATLRRHYGEYEGALKTTNHA